MLNRALQFALSMLFPLVTFGSAMSAQSTISATASPVELVRQTVNNEIKTNSDSEKFMFCDHKKTPQGNETKLLVETTEATAGLVIAKNGQPLTEDQQKQELGRVQRFVQNPDELKKKAKKEKEDEEHTIEIMKALPEAFLYEYAGTEPGRAGTGKAGDTLVRLNFHPNAAYNPPSHVEQVLGGMKGYLLIDATQHRIARIDGTLFRDVDFGWGFLGRLNDGGHFLVEQGDECEGHWELTHMNLNFQGKILMVKSLTINSDEVFTDFRKVPSDLTFAKGVDMLVEQRASMDQKSMDPKSMDQRSANGAGSN
jgi:hypothetical protein